MRYYAADLVSGPQLDIVRRMGFGNLTGPHRLVPVRCPGGLALDNGAWKVRDGGVEAWHQQMETPWRAAVWRYWRLWDFVVVPDIVAGGVASLRMSLEYLPWTRRRVSQVLIAVQDGLTPEDVAPHLGPGVGLAVGGSTDWKWSTLDGWAELGRSKRVWTHILRVNTQKKLRRCQQLGVTSADGSGVSQYADHARVMESWILDGKIAAMNDEVPTIGGRTIPQPPRATRTRSTGKQVALFRES